MGIDVNLRAASTADIETFYAFENDPEARRRANFPARDYQAFAHHWNSNVLGDESVAARAVLVDDETAGYLVAWWEKGRRTIGYWFGRQFWGRGAGTRALTLFLEAEPTRPLYADTDIGNAASRRLLERCGFREIETVRNGDIAYVLFVLD